MSSRTHQERRQAREARERARAQRQAKSRPGRKSPGAKTQPVSSSPPAQPDAGQSPGSLRSLAVRGGVYLAARELIGMFIRLGGMVLTLREVGPADFGIYSSGLAYIAVATVIAQMGTEIYLIRLEREPTAREYDEAFTHLVMSTLLVTAVAELLTLPLGGIIKPAGTLIPLRVMLLSIPCNVLWAPGQAYLERNFKYREMGIIEVSGDVVLYGVTVPLAFCGLGVWSMVIGLFAWQTWLLICSIRYSGLHYRLAFSRSGTRSMLRHGASYSSFSLINTLQQVLVPIVVGSFAGAVGVGYVSFALRLTTVLAFAQRNLSRIAIVAISKARNKSRRKLGAAISEGMVMMLVTTAVPFAGFGLLAKWIVPFVFGSAWSAALPVYATLAVFTVLYVFQSCRYAMFFAFDQNSKAVRSNVIQLAIMLGLAYPLVKAFGPVGYGYASLISLCSIAYSEWVAHADAPADYTRLLVPLVALLPPILAPLLPFPSMLLTLIGAVVVAAIPPARQQMVDLFRTGVAAVRGGRGSAASPPPEAATVAA